LNLIVHGEHSQETIVGGIEHYLLLVKVVELDLETGDATGVYFYKLSGVLKLIHRIQKHQRLIVFQQLNSLHWLHCQLILLKMDTFECTQKLFIYVVLGNLDGHQ